MLQAGYSVRALVRSRDKAREVLPQSDRLSLVVGDVLEKGPLQELLRDAFGCIHLVGIIREKRGPLGGKPQTFQRMHVDATRHMVAQCQASGVKRFVQMSAMGVTDSGVSKYQRTKFEAEQIVRRSNLDWTVFRPGLIHGPGGEFTGMAVDWAGGNTPPFLFMPYFTRAVAMYRAPMDGGVDAVPVVAPVWVEDVAAAFVASLENQASVGEIYNLAGPESLSWIQLLEYIRDAAHGNPHITAWGIPSEPAAIAADIAGFVGLGGLLPFDGGMARMAAQDSVADTTKARTDLKLQFAPFRKTFAAYAEQL